MELVGFIWLDWKRSLEQPAEPNVAYTGVTKIHQQQSCPTILTLRTAEETILEAEGLTSKLKSNDKNWTLLSVDYYGMRASCFKILNKFNVLLELDFELPAAFGQHCSNHHPEMNDALL